MSRLKSALAGLALAATALGAHAATVWICNLSEDIVHLVCVAEPDLFTAGLPKPARTAYARGLSYPLNTDLSYTVDLWSPPNDMAMVEQLAQATICYRSPECVVLLMQADWPWGNPMRRPWMHVALGN